MARQCVAIFCMGALLVVFKCKREPYGVKGIVVPRSVDRFVVYEASNSQTLDGRIPGGKVLNIRHFLQNLT